MIYTHQILDSQNIEPPNSTNHRNLQIITSFSYFTYDHIFICTIMYQVHIWQYIWIRLKKNTPTEEISPLFSILDVFEHPWNWNYDN